MGRDSDYFPFFLSAFLHRRGWGVRWGGVLGLRDGGITTSTTCARTTPLPNRQCTPILVSQRYNSPSEVRLVSP